MNSPAHARPDMNPVAPEVSCDELSGDYLQGEAWFELVGEEDARERFKTALITTCNIDGNLVPLAVYAQAGTESRVELPEERDGYDSCRPFISIVRQTDGEAVLTGDGGAEDFAEGFAEALNDSGLLDPGQQVRVYFGEDPCNQTEHARPLDPKQYESVFVEFALELVAE